MTEPRYMPLIAYPDAWSPSTKGAVAGRPVYVGDKTAEQIEAMANQLRGAIVLTHLPQTEFVDRTGLSPVSTTGRWPRAIRACRRRGPGRQPSVDDLMPCSLKKLGVAVALRPSAYRDGTVGVTGNRDTPSDAVPTIVDRR